MTIPWKRLIEGTQTQGAGALLFAPQASAKTREERRPAAGGESGERTFRQRQQQDRARQISLFHPHDLDVQLLVGRDRRGSAVGIYLVFIGAAGKQGRNI